MLVVGLEGGWWENLESKFYSQCPESCWPTLGPIPCRVSCLAADPELTSKVTTSKSSIVSGGFAFIFWEARCLSWLLFFSLGHCYNWSLLQFLKILLWAPHLCPGRWIASLSLGDWVFHGHTMNHCKQEFSGETLWPGFCLCLPWRNAPACSVLIGTFFSTKEIASCRLCYFRPIIEWFYVLILYNLLHAIKLGLPFWVVKYLPKEWAKRVLTSWVTALCWPK